MSWRSPPLILPGPLSRQTAAELTQILRELTVFLGGFSATPPLEVREDQSGVGYSLNVKSVAQIINASYPGSLLPVIDTTPIVYGSSDSTKIVRLEADTLVPTGTTVAITIPASSTTMAGLSISGQTFTTAQTMQLLAIGTATTVGLLQTNTTPAAAGAQQYSPAFQQSGQGWSTGSSASQSVIWSQQLKPVQGTTPTGTQTFGFNINGGGYVEAFQATSAGNLAAVGTLATNGTGIISVAAGKTFTNSNTLTLAGTDGSTLNVGAGGTLGTASFQNTGTSGANLPFLNGVNTWANGQTFSSTVDVSGTLTTAGNLVVNSGFYGLVNAVTWGTDQTDYAIAASTTGLGVTASANVVLNSIASTAGRTVWITNYDATHTLTIKHEGSGTATNRIHLPGAADVVLNQYESVGLYNDQNGSARWQCFAVAKNPSGFAVTSGTLAQFAATTSAQLRGVLSDESGTGAAYFQGGDLGTPSAGVATNLTGTASGLTAGTATVATTTTCANEATDTTCFPAFFTAATGDLGPKTNAAFTFNSNTGALGATSFTATSFILLNSTASDQFSNVLNNATTNVATDIVLSLHHNSSGTVANSFGLTVTYNLEDSTVASQLAASDVVSWVDKTHASFKARRILTACDAASGSPGRECVRLEASGTAAMIGFLGTAAVVQQTGNTVTALSNYGLVTSATWPAASITGTAFSLTTAAVQSDMETATSTSLAVVPGVVVYDPGVAKASCEFDGTGTPSVTINVRNVSSITDGGTGIWGVELTTAFSSGNYAAHGSTGLPQTACAPTDSNTVSVVARSSAGVLTDNATCSCSAFGDR